MVMVWTYGVWRDDNHLLLYLPAGIVAAICVASALAVPFITSVALMAAFLSTVDAGLIEVIRRCGEAVAAVGLLAAGWRGLVYMLDKRKIRHDEAGYP